LSRSGVRVLGPAIGGLLVVATSPGWALAADSASFFLSAALVGRMSLPAGPARVRERFFAELRNGWREFTSLTWLWTTVLLFGLGNISLMFWQVLGPAIAKQQLGGAGAWATILTAGGVGAIIGGIYALRHRPARPLVAAILWPLLVVPEYVLLANTPHVWLIAAAALVGGIGISVHVALWFTVFQTEVPEHARSRVASYDALGSMVLTPIGAAMAGPVALAVGNSAALWLAGLSIIACNAAMLAIPSVWTIHARGPRTA
jgi:MFS family permease